MANSAAPDKTPHQPSGVRLAHPTASQCVSEWGGSTGGGKKSLSPQLLRWFPACGSYLLRPVHSLRKQLPWLQQLRSAILSCGRALASARVGEGTGPARALYRLAYLRKPPYWVSRTASKSMGVFRSTRSVTEPSKSDCSPSAPSVNITIRSTFSSMATWTMVSAMVPASIRT